MKSSPNLLIDIIPTNSAHHSDEERASGGHFTDGASQKMVLKYTSNFTGGCNFSQDLIKNEHFLKFENKKTTRFTVTTLCCFVLCL